MSDVIEISYTGDLLAHRRCSRAWAYEKHVGFHPHEQVQAMEGRLVHHAMEWLTRQYADVNSRERHATVDELEGQLQHYFRVLWARGIRTTFASKKETIDNVVNNLFPGRKMHRTVKAAIEGARHTEYELRAVRKLLGPAHGGKRKLLLTGILDLVIQQNEPLEYAYSFDWTDRARLVGERVRRATKARPKDIEIWDYKGTRSSTSHVVDYARQLLTYAYLYRERTSELPARCVLYFVNERDVPSQLLAIDVDEDLIQRAVDWTHEQVDELQATIAQCQKDPCSVPGGDRALYGAPEKERVSEDLAQQCTACGLRFDCPEYRAYCGSKKPNHPDIDIRNVSKN